MRRSLLPRLLPPLLLLLLLGIAWSLAGRHGPWPHYLFPGPGAVVDALVRMWARGELQTALAATVRRLGIGFGASLAIGLVLAVLMSWNVWVRRTLKPFLLGFQSLPGLAWVPLALLWFGFTEDALIFVTMVGSIWAVTLAFHDGLATVPPLYFRAARNLGTNGWMLVTHVGFPAALPVLVGGAKQSWAFAWRSLVGAEIVFATVGLGFLLEQGRQYFNVAQVIAVMVATLAVGIVGEMVVFGQLERAVRRHWGLSP